MKIAKEDYKHVASFVGMGILLVGYFMYAKAGVEFDIAQHEKQVEHCESGLTDKDFLKYGCIEVLGLHKQF